MARQQVLSIYQLEDKLLEDTDSTGCCIGLVEGSTWKFLVYLGEQNLLVLFEKGNGLIKDSIQYISKNLDNKKPKFDIKQKTNLQLILVNQYKAFRSEAQFYKYDLNLFTTANNNKMKSSDLLQILQFNLCQIDQLEEGDIIMFERGLYHHSAVLTDQLHMMCIHRSGEPDNPGDLMIASTSLLGIPTAKASVTEDHLIEIAGYSKLKKSNEIFDKILTPKSKEEIVIEANKRLGEKGYSVTSKNCQHFASECRNGKPFSPEVNQVATVTFYSGVMGAMALFLTVFNRYFTANKTKKTIRTKNTS